MGSKSRIIFIVAFIVILVGGNLSTPLRDDEPEVLEVSKIVFNNLFVNFDISSPIWGTAEKSIDVIGTYTFNPYLPYYIFGFFERMSSFISQQFNIKTLVFMRILSSFLSSLIVVQFYELVKRSISYLGGILAVIILLLNPTFLSIQNSILEILPMLFFMLLCLNQIIILREQIKSKNIKILTVLLIGIFAGFTVSSRIYGVNVFLFLFLLLLFNRKNISLKSIALIFLVVCFVSFSIFFILNPQLYHDTIPILKDITVGRLVWTTGHLSEKTINPTSNSSIRYDSLIYLFLYPFILFRIRKFKKYGILKGDNSLFFFDYLIVGVVLFFIIYNYYRRGDKNYDISPTLYLISTLFIFVPLVLVIPYPFFFRPKHFIQLSFGIIWFLCSIVDYDKLRKVLKRLNKKIKKNW